MLKKLREKNAAKSGEGPSTSSSVSKGKSKRKCVTSVKQPPPPPEDVYDPDFTPVIEGFHFSTTAYLIIYRREEEAENVFEGSAEVPVPRDLQLRVQADEEAKQKEKVGLLLLAFIK